MKLSLFKPEVEAIDRNWYGVNVPTVLLVMAFGWFFGLAMGFFLGTYG